MYDVVIRPWKNYQNN